MKYREAPPQIVGVNEGVKLLQRFVVQYKPSYNSASNASSWTGEGSYSGNPNDRWRKSSGYGYQAGEGFYTCRITTSSDNTAICVKFQLWTGSNSTSLGYHNLSARILDGNEKEVDSRLPSFGWHEGNNGGGGSWGHGAQHMEYWYNSPGKDLTIEFRHYMTGHSSYRRYTQVPYLTDASNNTYYHCPWMMVEEWENGNPNHPQVEYWTNAKQGSSTTAEGYPPHPNTSRLGKTYEVKEFKNTYATNYSEQGGQRAEKVEGEIDQVTPYLPEEE